MNLQSFKDKCSQMGFADLKALKEISQSKYDQLISETESVSDKQALAANNLAVVQTISNLITVKFFNLLDEQD